MFLLGSILNLIHLRCFQNICHLPLIPLRMPHWLEYVKSVYNFKLQCKRGGFWSHLCHFAITGEPSPNWGENSPGHTCLHASLLQSASITLSSTHLLSHLLSVFLFSFFICTSSIPWCLLLPLCTAPLWLDLSVLLSQNVWFPNKWNAIPSRCHHSSDTK